MAVKPLRVLLFDVFGTLVDWRSSLIDIAETVAASADSGTTRRRFMLMHKPMLILSRNSPRFCNKNTRQRKDCDACRSGFHTRP